MKKNIKLNKTKILVGIHNIKLIKSNNNIIVENNSTNYRKKRGKDIKTIV